MGKEIVRVTIRSKSGFVPVGYAYEDRLRLDRRSVSYEHRPRIASDRNPARKWSYRTENPTCARLFDELAAAVGELLRDDGLRDLYADLGDMTLSVTCEDRGWGRGLGATGLPQGPRGVRRGPALPHRRRRA